MAQANIVQIVGDHLRTAARVLSVPLLILALPAVLVGFAVAAFQWGFEMGRGLMDEVLP